MALVSDLLPEEQRLRSSGLTPQHKLRRWLIVGLVSSNLLTFVLSIDSLVLSRHHFEQRAEVLTQNVANAVDQSVSSSIDRIDLALRTVADELERQLAAKGIDESAVNNFLARQLDRLPEVEAFRVAQADGLVILGKGVKKQERVSWADRDYFIFHKEHPDGGLQISKPRMGRVAKQYIVGFSRRFNYPDGRFAGVISAPIAVDHFNKLLTQFDLGTKGTINLRDTSLGLVTRVPAIPNKPVGQVGSSDVSKELRQIFESGASTSTYFTAASADGFERISTFRRLSNAPMIVLSGVAKEDYLAGWNTEMYRTLSMVVGFFMVSVLLGGFLLRLLTEAERRDRELSQSKAIIDSSHDAIVSTTLEGTITSWNHGAQRIFGYTSEEIIGKEMQILLPTDRQNEESEMLERISHGERVDHFNTLRLCKDGSLIDVSVTISPIRDGRGQVIGASKIVRDITAQKQAQLRLEQLLAEQNALLENDLVCIVRVKNRRIVWANPAFERMLGYALGELSGTPTRQNYPSEEAYQAFGAAAYALLSTGQIFRSQVELVRKDGSSIWVDISGAMLDADSGESLWCFVDITEHKLIQAAQDQMNALRRALLDNSAVGIFLTSTYRTVLEVSQRMCEMFGYSPAEFVGQSTRLIHVSEECFETFGNHYAFLETSSKVAFEYPFRHCDGHVIWCSVIGTPLETGDLDKGVIWTFLDIEERRRLAAEAEKDRKLLKDIVESIPAAVSYWSAQDVHNIRNVFNNRSYADLYEMTSEQLVGMHVRDLLGVDIYLANWSRMAAAREGEHIVYNRFQPSVNGKPPRHVQVHYIPDIRDGEPQGLYVMMFDTTDLKNSELALIAARDAAEEAARIKSQFLANMSHEIRTPMNAIIGLTGLALETELTPRQYDYLNKVSSSAKALLRLLNDVLDYSKLEARQFALENIPFSIDEVIQHVEDVFAFRLEEKGLYWRVEKKADVPPIVIGDALRLGQALINLVGNAIKFTETGEIALSIVLLAETSSTVSLRISVADTGIGMSPEGCERIFAVFAQADSSVCRKYGGTGLGLSITQQIVHLMGGEIKVNSKLGSGSTFDFTATFGRVSQHDLPTLRLEPDQEVPAATLLFGPELRPLLPAECERCATLLSQLKGMVASNNFAARGAAEEIEEMLTGTNLAPDFTAVITALRKLRFKNAGEGLRAFCQNHADLLGKNDSAKEYFDRR